MDLFLVYFHLLSTKAAACSTHSSCSLCSPRFADITRHRSLEKTHGSTSWWKLPVSSGHCEVWSLLFGATVAEMSQKKKGSKSFGVDFLCHYQFYQFYFYLRTSHKHGAQTTPESKTLNPLEWESEKAFKHWLLPHLLLHNTGATEESNWYMLCRK